MSKQEWKRIKEEVKSRISIVDVISRYVTLEPAGKDFKARCPFHSENTASFFVSNRKGSFHCFGCETKGDVITFVMEQERLQFIPTLKKLAKEIGVEIPAYSAAEVPVSPDFSDFTITEKAGDLFHRELIHSDYHSPLWKFLKKRKLDNINMIKEFGLGYCPNNVIDEFKKLYDRPSHYETAKKIGLVKEGSYGDYCLFNGRLIFPIRNMYGKIAGFAGRALSDEDTKYINSSASTIYQKSEILYGYYEHCDVIRRAEEVIIVEGYTDLLRLHQEGIQNVVAICGTALTQEHTEMLKEVSEKVIFLMDGDTAGAKATIRRIPIVLSYGFNVRVAVLPEKDDPDSFVLQNGIDTLKNLLKESEDPFAFAYKFLVEEKKGELDEIDLQVFVADELTKLILDFPIQHNLTLYRVYLRQIDKLVGLGVDMIEANIERFRSERKKVDEPISVMVKSPTDEEIEELEQIISKKNLILAWKKVHKFAREHDLYFDEIEFREFEERADAYITVLHHQLRQLIEDDVPWEPQPFRDIRIRKLSGDFREVVIPSSVQDRILIQAILNIVAPKIEPRMSPNSFGHRLSSEFESTDCVFTPWIELYGNYHKKLRSFLDSPESYYYIKTDISSFYSGVNLEMMREKVVPFFRSGWAASVLEQFLNYKIFGQDGNIIRHDNFGLPQGPAYGHFLANVYLMRFDRFIEKEIAITSSGELTADVFQNIDSAESDQEIDPIRLKKSLRYIRYVDDIFILFRSKKEAEEGKRKIKVYLASEGLQLNEDKTGIYPITESKVIIDEIRKKKYDLGRFFDIEESLTVNQKEALYNVTELEFLTVSTQEDLLSLNQHINWIVHFLKGTDYFEQNEDDLTNLVIELIFSESFKHSSADSLFRKMLPNILSGTHEEKFLKYLQQADYFKLLFIFQAIRRYDFYNQLTPAFQKYVQSLLKHEDYFVRIAAADCLTGSRYVLDLRSLKPLVIGERVSEARKAFIRIGQMKDSSPLRVFYQGRLDPELRLQHRILLQLSKGSPTLSVYLLKQIQEYDPASVVLALYIVLRYPIRDGLEVLNNLAKRVDYFHELLSAHLDKVYALSPSQFMESTAILDLYHNLDVVEDELIRDTLRERLLSVLAVVASENEEDTELQQRLVEMRDEIDRKATSRVTEIVKYSEDKKNYTKISLPFLDGAGIQHFSFENKHSGSVISFELINEESFPVSLKLSDFREKMEELKYRNIVYYGEASIVKTDRDRSQLMIKYSFESRWTLLYQQIQKEALSESRVASIVAAIQKKKSRSVTFIPNLQPSPFTVAVDAFDNPVFVHIGTSLLSQRYTSHKKRTEENDSSSYDSLFLGWLSFELLTQACPFREKVEIKKSDLPVEYQYLSYSKKLTHTSLMYRRFLERLTYDNPRYRYPLDHPKLNVLIKEYLKAVSEHRKWQDEGIIREKMQTIQTLNFLNVRVSDFVARGSMDNKSLSDAIQFAFHKFVGELVYLAEYRGIHWFANLEEEILKEDYFHLGTRNLIQFNQRLERIQKSVRVFPVTYKTNLVILYLALRVETMAISYRFIDVFRSTWKSKY